MAWFFNWLGHLHIFHRLKWVKRPAQIKERRKEDSILDGRKRMCVNSWEVFLVVIKKKEKKKLPLFSLCYILFIKLSQGPALTHWEKQYECTVRKGNVNFGIKGKSTRITDCDNHFKVNKWSDEIGGFQQANLDSLAREGLWVLGDENKSFTSSRRASEQKEQINKVAFIEVQERQDRNFE